MAWFRMMGVDSVEYHRATVLGRADDHPAAARRYYGTHGETPLEWGGNLAARLGLAGPVTDEDYDAVFGPGGAIDPHLGRRMVQTRRPGVELVVSAHKSVAVLGVLGAVDYMHTVDAESDATMAFLDGWFCRQGGRRRLGHSIWSYRTGPACGGLSSSDVGLRRARHVRAHRVSRRSHKPDPKRPRRARPGRHAL